MVITKSLAYKSIYPKKPHFRFENLTTYSKLSGQNVKEMDCIFIDKDFRSPDRERLYFLEVKSFEKFLQFPLNQSHEEKLVKFKDKLPDTKAELAKTVIDALLMMSAVWLKTEKRKVFRS